LNFSKEHLNKRASEIKKLLKIYPKAVALADRFSKQDTAGKINTIRHSLVRAEMERSFKFFTDENGKPKTTN
jgi:hypothetical protein